MNQIRLSKEQIQAFRETARLHLHALLDIEQTNSLQRWVDDLETWPETPLKWMKYFEHQADTDRQLCRIENFLDYHDGLRELINGPTVLNIVSQLMESPAVLFKEKINFKLPGGSGFKAHQDAPAFQNFGPDYHITMMLSVDATTPENGGLEFSDTVAVNTYLPQSADGSISSKLEDQMSWQPIRTAPGDVIFFDSFIPHRSGPNGTNKRRRVLYITYNRASDGDVRANYYALKRDTFPPDCERIPGVDYSKLGGQFNVGNPIN